MKLHLPVAFGGCSIENIPQPKMRNVVDIKSYIFDTKHVTLI